MQKIEGKKGGWSLVPSNFGKSIRFQGLRIIFCGYRLDLLGPWLWPQSSFFMKGSMCFQLSSFVSLFPACEFWKSNSLFYTLFLLCPFQSILAVFLLIHHSQETCGFVTGIHSIKQESPTQIHAGWSHFYSWFLLRCVKRSISQMVNLFKHLSGWLKLWPSSKGFPRH